MKKPVVFYVDSEQHAEYLDKIAYEKGFKNKGEMARYGLQKLLTGMKVPFLPKDSTTGRDH
jgi:hypothetical protein